MMDFPHRFRELIYLRKGFPGILFKYAQIDQTFRAIKKIFLGELWFRREILNALYLESLGTYPFFGHITRTTARLTPREVETLLFCRYYRDPERVTKRIGVSRKTMRMYLHRLYDKLSLYNFSELNIFTSERALDHYPLMKYKGISGMMVRPRETVALVSDNMALYEQINEALERHFHDTSFHHIFSSDPEHEKKLKKIAPDIIIRNNLDGFVPSLDKILSHLFLSHVSIGDCKYSKIMVNKIHIGKGWKQKLLKFMKGSLFDFWLPRSFYEHLRDKALTQSHLQCFLPWAYDRWGDDFTRMEIKIFFMLKFCYADREIADRLNITHSGVRLHVNNLLHKTNTKSRHDLIFSEQFFKDRFPFFNDEILEKDPSGLSKQLARIL